MEYFKAAKTKETKIRLKEDLYIKIKKTCEKKQISVNKFINDIISKQFLKKDSKKLINEDLFREEKKILLKRKDIEIYNNNFISANIKHLNEKVDLIVTSPPYNVSLEYSSHDDSSEYENYLDFNRAWLRKSFSLLKEGGRLCLNIPLDKNKNGLKPVYADMVKIAEDIGFGYQSTIIWNEQNISRRTAWGSWLSASAPYVIAPVEMIVLLYKGQWKRLERGVSTIEKEEFIEWTNGVWTFPGESKKRIGHPAPFPLELPRRCIKLFSYKNDIVLDPFLGSGTTLLAAALEERKGVGFEIDASYIDLSIKRLEKELGNLFM